MKWCPCIKPRTVPCAKTSADERISGPPDDSMVWPSALKYAIEMCTWWSGHIGHISRQICCWGVSRQDTSDCHMKHWYWCIRSHASPCQILGWMDTGVNSKITRRLIDISDLAIKLSAPICDLPSFHALNGCDYTASFLRKAKWKPFQIIKNNSRFTTAIGHLGDSDVLDLGGMVTVEEYVCCVYGVYNLSSESCMPSRKNETYGKRSKHQILAAYHLANGFFSRSC